jgi:hypothetical protein
MDPRGKGQSVTDLVRQNMAEDARREEELMVAEVQDAVEQDCDPNAADAGEW